MEKLQTIDLERESNSPGISYILQDIANILHTWRDELFWIGGQLNQPTKAPKIKNVIRNRAKEIADHITKEDAETVHIVETQYPELNKDWLMLLTEEMIMKFITDRTDLHVGNLGITPNGKFRYFDPAYKEGLTELNV